jgi:anti-sigma-K factor RskA
MTPAMSHDETRAMLAAEALDALTGLEREAVLAHVAGCAECAALLAELRDTGAALATIVPGAPMDAVRSAAVRNRLLARAAADAAQRGEAAGALPFERPVKALTSPTKQSEREPTREVSRSLVGRGGWYAAAAAVILSMGLFAALRSTRRNTDALRNELAVVRADKLEAETRLASRDSLLEQLTGPTVRVVDLAARGPAAPAGWMFSEQSANRWTLVVRDLPAVAANRTYQLWLITPGQRKLSAGTFATDERGHALVRATFALPSDSLAAIAVTEEPAGGVPQPTGAIVLSGS